MTTFRVLYASSEGQLWQKPNPYVIKDWTTLWADLPTLPWRFTLANIGRCHLRMPLNFTLPFALDFEAVPDNHPLCTPGSYIDVETQHLLAVVVKEMRHAAHPK